MSKDSFFATKQGQSMPQEWYYGQFEDRDAGYQAKTASQVGAAQRFATMGTTRERSNIFAN